MSTLTKKPAAQKTLRKAVKRKTASGSRIGRLAACLPLPPSKGTAADLLRSIHDGSFDRAAAKVNWDMVESAYKNRHSSRAVRASA